MQMFSPAEAERLLDLSQQNLRDLRRHAVLTLGQDQGNRTVYSFADLLTIEVAKQLYEKSDQGISWKRAFNIAAFSGGIDEFLNGGNSRAEDFWIAELYSANESGAGGKAEAPAAGSLSSIVDEIKSFQKNNRYFPDAPSRILMTNVSAADRRLHARALAACLRIEIVENGSGGIKT